MNVLKPVIYGISSQSVWERIAWMYASFFLLLLPVTILSYFLLPEGILRGKHPLTGFELSPILWISTLQIFGYNLIFTLLMIGANLFARQSRIYPERFIPIGYLAFWGVTVTSALYLGTWSQEVVTPAPPLLDRLLRLLDILHRAAPWELSGYLLAAATSYKFTLLYTDGKQVVAQRSWWSVSLTTMEKILFALSFVLLLCGALIESYGIIQLAG